MSLLANCAVAGLGIRIMEGVEQMEVMVEVVEVVEVEVTLSPRCSVTHCWCCCWSAP